MWQPWASAVAIGAKRIETRHWSTRYCGPLEKALGDYAPGRYGWIFENARLLREPIPFKGHQGFFNVPDELLAHD